MDPVKIESLDLVRIQSFCYTVRVQHLTPPAIQARITEDKNREAIEKRDADVDRPPSLMETDGSLAKLKKKYASEQGQRNQMMNQQTPMYDLILLLPNNEHEGIGQLARLEVLRRFPSIGAVLGDDFEKDAIELTIHNVALIGLAFGDAHALTELEAAPRG